MNILFLDLSTKSTGWCVGQEGKIIKYGCITSASQNVLKRITIMVDEIQKIVETYDIVKIVAEEVRTDYKNIHTYKVLNWIQGITLYKAFQFFPKIEYEFIQPSTWRSQIGIHTGRGIKRDELKQEDIKYVKNKYNIEANDDVCDAICLMDAYYIKTLPVSGFDWS